MEKKDGVQVADGTVKLNAEELVEMCKILADVEFLTYDRSFVLLGTSANSNLQCGAVQAKQPIMYSQRYSSASTKMCYVIIYSSQWDISCKKWDITAH